MKSVSIVEGEATPTRSVPLPEEEKEEESEEARERPGGVRGGHAHHITLNFYSKY